MTDRAAIVTGYHQRTKHQPQRYARSLGYLDWANQPDPFRRFEGAPQLPLDLVEPTDSPRYDDLFGGAIDPHEPDRGSVSQLFQDSLALSAWKEFQGSRWSLRVNPSSGNLHPTEGYLLAGPIPGLHARAALYHYAPSDHNLELRRELPDDAWAELSAQLPKGALLVGLTSIHWRESWKYGERAYRYCQHDVGHAIAAVTLAAAALGWQARLLDTIDDDALARLLAVEDQQGIEAEHPDCLLMLWPHRTPAGGTPRHELQLPAGLLERIVAEPARGRRNALSVEHHDWPVIDEVAAATRRELHNGWTPWSPPESAPPEPRSDPRPTVAGHLFAQRRSAVAMDGRTAIDSETFFLMLRRLTANERHHPMSALTWRPRIHPVLFVHRVTGVPSGVYVLLREPGVGDALRSQARAEFLWEPVSGGPDGLFLLLPTDCRDAARTISCHQDIAADGAFAVGMLAEFESSLREPGAWFYRHLHWEAGAIGQLLYLEAEAAGVRGTGIGCFFDDAMHELLGLSGQEFQTLYHFTVGGPVEDPRLRTAAPYGER